MTLDFSSNSLFITRPRGLVNGPKAPPFRPKWCTSDWLNSLPKVSSETLSAAPPLMTFSSMCAANYFLLDVPVLTFAGAIFLRFF